MSKAPQRRGFGYQIVMLVSSRSSPPRTAAHLDDPAALGDQRVFGPVETAFEFLPHRAGYDCGNPPAGGSAAAIRIQAYRRLASMAAKRSPASMETDYVDSWNSTRSSLFR